MSNVRSWSFKRMIFLKRDESVCCAGYVCFALTHQNNKETTFISSPVVLLARQVLQAPLIKSDTPQADRQKESCKLFFDRVTTPSKERKIYKFCTKEPKLKLENTRKF